MIACVIAAAVALGCTAPDDTGPTTPAQTLAAASPTGVAAAAVPDCDYRPGNQVAPIPEPTPAPDPPPPPTMPPRSSVDRATTDRHLEILNELASLVEQKYVDPGLNGLDWPAIVERHRSIVEGGLSDESFELVLNMMVSELGDEHSFVQSAEHVREAEERLAGQTGYVGIGVFLVHVAHPNRAIVLIAIPGGPAERAGLRASDRIIAIDGQPLPDADTEVADRIRGPAGTTGKLTIERPGEDTFDIEIVREAIPGGAPVAACVVPGTRLGYVMLPTLNDLTLPDRVASLISAMDARVDLAGLIVDNRLNPGGDGRVLSGMLELFVDGQVGTFQTPDAQRPLVVDGRDVGGSQDLRLAVLVGAGTFSFGEVMTGVLQQVDDARVIGAVTAGNVEVLHGLSLPHGWRAFIAHERFEPAVSGYGPWEETGIIPDIHVPTRWDTFTAATDPALAAAVDALSD